MPKKKKFIDKKNAVTFHLVHRSQKDPLQADDEAPLRVLKPTNVLNSQKDDTKRQEEQRKVGVYYDDEYDYMQHLKDVDELHQVEPVEMHTRLGQANFNEATSTSHKVANLKLPSTVFGTDLETEVGLLNKAAPLRGPQVDWDPDIVAGLDEDFDYEDPDNQLDDDFVVKANKGVNAIDNPVHGYDGEEDPSYASDEAMSDENDSLEGKFPEFSFSDEETKTQFTNYSMTSSIIRRSEGLVLLDDKFEKVFEEYEDTEIGALDHEDIAGHRTQGSQLLNNVLEEFEGQQKEVTLKDVVEAANEDVNIESDNSSHNDEDIVDMVTEKPTEKWDCESILSTYSNIYNHPKTIEEPKKIKLFNKAGLPLRLSRLTSERVPTRKQLEEMSNSTRESQDKACTYRPKKESTEERKVRKEAVKQDRKERRLEKKETKQAFKSEMKRQKKEIIDVQNNLQGIKIA